MDRSLQIYSKKTVMFRDRANTSQYLTNLWDTYSSKFFTDSLAYLIITIKPCYWHYYSAHFTDEETEVCKYGALPWSTWQLTHGNKEETAFWIWIHSMHALDHLIILTFYAFLNTLLIMNTMKLTKQRVYRKSIFV